VWATAALLSLRGVNAVLLNQWSMDAVRNHSAANAVVANGLLSGGQVLGKAHGAASGQLLAAYHQFVKDVANSEAELAQISELREVGLGQEAARARRAEEVDAARAAAQERGQDFQEPQEEEPLEFPTEEQVEEEKTKLEGLIGERDKTDEDMRGVEGALVLALYGIPTLSC